MSVPPWLLLLLLFSLAVSLAYQLVTNRYGWRILGYWAVLFLAALGAEALAESLGWNVTRYGDLRVLPDLAGMAIFIGIFWFLHI